MLLCSCNFEIAAEVAAAAVDAESQQVPPEEHNCGTTMTHGNDFLPGAAAADYDETAAVAAADGNSWMNRSELSKTTLSWGW